MTNYVSGVSQTLADPFVQDKRWQGGTSGSFKLGGKGSFTDVIEALAAKKEKGTTTEIYINAQGERILKITSDKGVQYRKIGHVNDAIWMIPVVTE